MKRILFVDDEPAILDGLRHVLRPERKRWEMEFADGGEAALELMAQRPFDVIVTDMRMPGMDGLAVLRHVRRSFPSVARIVLSGYADLAAVAQASSVAHQYLLKPCEADALRRAVERALRLQDLLSSEALRRAVGGLGTLPSGPRVYQALSAALGDPDVDVKKLAAIVQQDVGVSARVLQFVNSAYFGLSRRVTSIEAAIVCLGLNALRHLALTQEVFKAFPGISEATFAALEHHAALTARIARRLTTEAHQVEIAFAAGLLHDAGRIVLMSRASEGFARAADEARRRGVPLIAMEKEILGATHAEVGGYLLGLWELPHELVDPVAFHHDAERLAAGGFETVHVVAAADLLAHEVADGDGEGSAALEALPFNDRLTGWREIARAEARRMS